MKRTVRVTLEKEFEIDIPDSLLTNEVVAEFHAMMFETNSEDDFFKYVAGQIAQYGTCFVEGLGQAVPEYMKQFSDVAEPITYEEIDSFVETEIL